MFRTNFHESQFIYTILEPKELITQHWYHSDITKVQAEAALKNHPVDNGFLVRVSDESLVLSKSILGWVSHDIIHRSPRGYQLDGKDDILASIPEMITYYQDHAVGDFGQVLGTGIISVPSS